MKQNKTILTHFFWVLVFLCLPISTLQAQESAQSPLSLNITVLDESIAFPGTAFLKYNYNPALKIGAEYVLKQRKRYNFHVVGSLGGYHHKNWETGLFLHSEIGYKFFFGRFNAYARLGVGYLHTFATEPVYKNKDGAFQKVTDLGNSNLLTSFALGLGYRLKQINNSPEIFLTMMEAVELPFSIYADVHLFVGLGVKFYFPR